MSLGVRGEDWGFEMPLTREQLRGPALDRSGDFSSLSLPPATLPLGLRGLCVVIRGRK
jgi:hypothetical protein